MPALKREEKEIRARGKEIAENMECYLNQMEEILSTPMGVDEKSDAFNQIALLVGKAMVSFTDLENNYDIFGYKKATPNKEN